MTMRRRRSTVSVGVLLLHLQQCLTFQTHHDIGSRVRPRNGAPTIIASSAVTDKVSPSPEETELRLDPEAIQLKDDLIALASATRRGFSASRSDRNKAKEIINSLSKYSPCNEPAAAYYTDKESEGGTTSANRSTLAGKWTLIYTDAPDITSLEGGPFATAKLGRIGQECNPPSIKNVIEWLPPDWASSLPFVTYDESSRVLQKVCCEGSASPETPKAVDLKLVGLELLGEKGTESGDGDEGSSRSDGFNSIFGGPAALLKDNPVKLQGPLTAPFGKFEILYLDDEMRITKTYQGYVAVNVREADPWF